MSGRMLGSGRRVNCSREQLRAGIRRAPDRFGRAVAMRHQPAALARHEVSDKLRYRSTAP